MYNVGENKRQATTINTPILEFRNATTSDIEKAKVLLDANFRGSLTESEMQDGFISVHFSVENLMEMTANGITVVASTGGEIAGALFAQSCSYNMIHVPLAAKMVTALDRMVVDDLAINVDNSIVCGPVCISKDYRGLGLLNSLYDRLKREAKGRYQIGLTLVSRNNPRSTRAHEKVGMKIMTSFESDGRLFDAFAMRFE